MYKYNKYSLILFQQKRTYVKSFSFQIIMSQLFIYKKNKLIFFPTKYLLLQVEHYGIKTYIIRYYYPTMQH